MIGKEAPFTHLRPATTPEMLDRAYAVAIRFAPLLLIGSFFAAAEHLLTWQFDLIDGPAGSAQVAAVLGMVLAGEYTSAMALLALFQGIIFPLRPLSVKAVARTALRKLPGYLLTHLIYVFILVLAGTISWGFFTSNAGIDTPYFNSVTGALTAIGGLYIAFRFSLAPISCLIEDTSPHKAFGRSWVLTAPRPRTFNFATDRPLLRWLAVAALPVTIIAVITGFFVAYSYIHYHRNILVPEDNIRHLYHLMQFAASMLAAPFYWAGLMALYIEYRMRHEALDYYLRIRELRRINGATDPFV